MVKSENREQELPQGVDTVRDVETDVITAEAEMKEQTIHEKTTKEVPDSGTTDHPMTTGHLEIQAVNEAVREDHRINLLNNAESVSRDILRFPDRLTSLLVRQKAELVATRKDRDAVAEILRAAEENTAAAEEKEMELVAKTEAFGRDKNVADEKMKEVTDCLKAVETKEKLVAGRERRVVRLEEEQALEDLSNGANAAMEDGAEAAAAEARESAKSTGPIIGLTAPTTPVENETIPTHLQQTPNFPPAGKHILLGRETAIAAKEEKLWHMENNLAFRETNLHLREAALFAREQLLERMETAQIQLTDNWKAQVEIAYAGLEAEGEDLGAKFRALIALQGMVEGTQAKARGMIGRGGDDEDEDKGA